MNKTWIIIKREFLSRVQKKTFLLTTILLPLLIIGFYALIIFFSVKGESTKRIAIVDEYNLFDGKIESEGSVQLSLLKGKNVETYKKEFTKEGYQAFVYIPADLNLENPGPLTVYGEEQLGMGSLSEIRDRINKTIDRRRMQALLGSTTTLDQLNNIKTRIELKSVNLKDGGEKESNAATATIIAFAMGILVYFVLMIYGSMVMRGVMEEKTNRIAEVMVSSVKPFQLMMGKIIGIGAVGLVQFLIWGILIIGIQILIPLIFPGVAEQMAQQSSANPGMGGQMVQAAQSSGAEKALGKLMSGLGSINIVQIVVCFIIYFLGGYFMYSSLFAAVGSSVNEDPQDAQQLMLPVMMPIIFSFVILTKVIQDPNSGLAVFGSLFPLTSPIVMMGRIPFGVPGWQLALSIGLLIGGFLLTTWLAGKIYRTGILMYGKKVTWKEIIKWVRR